MARTTYLPFLVLLVLLVTVAKSTLEHGQNNAGRQTRHLDLPALGYASCNRLPFKVDFVPTDIP
jgi:hypothetical protein